MQFDRRIAKRSVCFLIGLSVAGLGVALSTRPGLGTSPITSLPYVTTFAFPWTLGMATVAVNIFFIFLQMIILKTYFQWKLFWQLPTLLLFGGFIDGGMFLTSFFIPENYLLRVVEEIIGCVVLASGIGLLLAADISFMPGDGLIKTVSQVYKVPFGTVKVCFDSSIVISAIVFSLIFFRNITGVREGTLLAAVLVGWFIRLQQPWIQKIKSYCNN